MTTETNLRPFTAAGFQQFLQEGQLVGARCQACGNLYLPAREICPHCFSDQIAWAPLSGEGKLAAFTSITIAPTAMEAQGFGRDNPYCTGIVELAEGVKISARILGVDAKTPTSIPIGLPLKAIFLDEGTHPVLAFEPV